MQSATKKIMAKTNATENIDLQSLLAKMASKGVEQQAGFKIPTSVAALKDFVIGSGVYKSSEIIAPRLGRFAEKVAYNFGKNEEESAVIGRMANNTWRSGVLLLPTLIKAGSRYQQSASDYFGMGNRFSNTLKSQGKSANFFNAVNSDLEVIRNERSHVASKIANTSKLMFIDAVATLPGQIGTRIDQVINDIKAIDSSGETQNNKKTNQSTEISRKAAEKINEGFNKTLKNLEGDNGKYNAFANIAASTLTSVDNLNDLESPIGRVQFLQDLKNTYFGTVSAGFTNTISGFISKKMDVKTEKQMKNVNAASMISALTEHLKKNPNPTELTLIGGNKKGCTLEEYIMDIFEQHQKDCGRSEIPRRMKGRMSDAIKQIAEAISDPNRQMHAEALIQIVDKKHGIGSYHKNEMSEVLHGEDLNEYLAKLQQKPNMSRRRKSTAEKQYKHMQATPEQFKQSWGNLTQDEKFLWSTFLSDEILADLGVEKQERLQLRHQNNEFWLETMEEILKEMSQLKPSELKNVGLNDSQISLLQEAFNGVSRRSNDYLYKSRSELTEMIADAATLMDDQQPGFIKNILERAQERRSHKDIISQKQKDRPLAEQVSSRRDEKPENSRY